MLYDDDDHDLFLTPQASSYSSTKGGASRHMLVNGRNHRVAVKIKCSNNDIYRVSPVYCNLEPGQSVRVQVVRDPGQPGTDKLVVLYRPSRYSNPRDAYKEREGQDNSDIRKKLIGLVAKPDSEDEGEPPPPPTAPPPLMDGSPPPPPHPHEHRRPPAAPRTEPPPIGLGFPMVPTKSIRRKPGGASQAITSGMSGMPMMPGVPGLPGISHPGMMPPQLPQVSPPPLTPATKPRMRSTSKKRTHSAKPQRKITR